MSEKFDNIKYSSPGNLIYLTIDKSYNLLSFNIDESLLLKDQKELLEEMIVSSINEAIDKVTELNGKEDFKETKTTQFDFNKKDINKVMGDITKLTSVRYENGKPVLTISLDSITPDMVSKMTDLIKNNKDNEEDQN